LSAEGVLKRSYEHAWQDRRARTRTAVLLYLASARLEDGKPLILAGLRSRKERVRVYALTAANLYILKGGWEPDQPTRSAIERIVERDTDSQFRPLAFDVLRAIKDPATIPTFERIAANDPDLDFRIDANMELLRRGQGGALRALFAEQRKHRQSFHCFPEAREIVERLGLPISRREEERLGRLAARAIQYHRARLRDASADEFERAISARFLALHCSQRDALEDDDLDAMGNLALEGTRTNTGPIIRIALGLIDSRPAKRWLKKLGGPVNQ
jgi:hypothetical protein